MSMITGKRMVGALLTLSLLLNFGLVGYLAKSGGLRRIFIRMDLVDLKEDRRDFQKELETRYRKYPNTAAEIDFVGDSLTGGGPWAEFYSEVHNRGIGGETTSGMLGRLDEVLEAKPRKIFLLLGTNDLSKVVPVSQYIRNYRAILERVRKDSPETKIYVIAITPVNSSFAAQWVYGNAQVIEANEQLKKLVAEFPGVTFVDLTSYLVDEKGELRREFTSDGGHLNDDAYLAIREPLGRYVADDASRAEAKH